VTVGSGACSCFAWPPSVEGSDVPSAFFFFLFWFGLGEREDEEMTVEESRHEEEYVAAVAEKDAGNKHFSAGEYERAKGSYLLALNLLQDGGNPVVTREANDLACKLHTNAAAVFIKLGDPLSAIEHCKLALAIDKRNVKALFRRAECLKSLGHYSEALVQLERALLIEENNEEIKESMDECEDLLEFQEHAETFEGEDLGAAQSPAAGDGSDRRELPEDVLLALESKISGLRDEVLGGRAEVDEHVMLNHGESKFGMIEIKDAFMGPSNLSSALQFVRGQHLTATAKFAVSGPARASGTSLSHHTRIRITLH